MSVTYPLVVYPITASCQAAQDRTFPALAEFVKTPTARLIASTAMLHETGCHSDMSESGRVAKVNAG